ADFWKLRLRGFRDEPDQFGSSYEEQAGRAAADVARDVLAPGTWVVGAFAPELVGIAGLTREPRRKRRHRAALWGMYVVPEARGRGVARALVDEIIRIARGEAGLEQILLSVMAPNAPAIGLYAKLGFVAYARVPRALLVGGRAIDEELMLLDLRRVRS